MEIIGIVLAIVVLSIYPAHRVRRYLAARTTDADKKEQISRIDGKLTLLSETIERIGAQHSSSDMIRISRQVVDEHGAMLDGNSAAIARVQKTVESVVSVIDGIQHDMRGFVGSNTAILDEVERISNILVYRGGIIAGLEEGQASLQGAVKEISSVVSGHLSAEAERMADIERSILANAESIKRLLATPCGARKLLEEMAAQSPPPPIEVIIEKIVEVPVEVRVEVDREVIVDRPVEVIVEKEVVVEREVPVEVIVEKEVIIDRPVEVIVEREVVVEKTVSDEDVDLVVARRTFGLYGDIASLTKELGEERMRVVEMRAELGRLQISSDPALVERAIQLERKEKRLNEQLALLARQSRRRA